jgi:hypothetical protein
MTTLVALSTKDALVMGCDSLGSVNKDLVDPYELFSFFDPHDDWNIKRDSDGNPLLANIKQIMDLTESIPYNHMTHVTKLCSLDPLPMGIMTAGITSIGNRTIRSLISEFKQTDKAFSQTKPPTNYTVRSIGDRIKRFIFSLYQTEYQEGGYKPALEFIIGGYDKQSPIPSIYRIHIESNELKGAIDDFGIVFGGQMQEIQRIVFGSDIENKFKMMDRSNYLLNKYHELLSSHLQDRGISEELPQADTYSDTLRFFNDDYDLDGFDARWGDFSEQNAIECVDFFINIMIKSQQFSSRLPTVGGDVHIALITKDKGFRYISGEELQHGEHFVEL